MGSREAVPVLFVFLVYSGFFCDFCFSVMAGRKEAEHRQVAAKLKILNLEGREHQQMDMGNGSAAFCVEKLQPLTEGDARFWTTLSASYTARTNWWGSFFNLVSL